MPFCSKAGSGAQRVEDWPDGPAPVSPAVRRRIVTAWSSAPSRPNAACDGATWQAPILPYADVFAADHALRVLRQTPLHQRRG